ncbi:hypothetical protein [Nocardioides scoriae]|uniref:hypothetical protein n=1 Tax=Nocardioides scoriae TaxID=642780 RepID=UPI000B8A2A59|nr:hypothetical protein [Nocardioides scoriae]
MLLGLVCASAASLCYGTGSVLQAVAARSTEAGQTLDPRLLLRLARSWRYLLGVGLDGLGFVLALVAVRSLPLFAVQAVVASFLAVAAALGAVVLRTPLRRSDRVGLAVVVGGLVLVALSAAAERAAPVTTGEQVGLLVATALLVGLAVLWGRLAGSRGAALLGAAAGLGFGVTSIGARMLPPPGPGEGRTGWLVHLLAQPASYAVVLGGAVALLAYSTALQRGSVAVATAPLVVGETVVPALVGVWLLGDRTRPGWEPVAVAGFVLAVAGAVALARHGEPGDGVSAR